MRPDVVAVLADLVQTLKTDPQWLQTTQSLGALPHVLTPAESEKFIMDQYRKFSALGEKLNIIIK